MVGYWMDKPCGLLRPAVEAYLNGEPLTLQDCAAIRAYLREWFIGPWHGEAIRHLKDEIATIVDRGSFTAWLAEAADEGIEPI